MDKKYIELFKELSQATAVSAEMVMNYNKNKGEENSANTAAEMRDEFQELTSRINEDSENYKLNKIDAARLLIGAIVQASQLVDNIERLKKALMGYQSDIIPKLQEIIDKASTDEEVQTMANEKFVIQETT